jgi:hypothetical protein
MALTFPTGTRYPSNVALLPNNFIRPAFEELYGFDAKQDVGLATPDISVVQFGGDGATISTSGVSGATSYTYERDTDSGFSSPTTISSGTLDLTVNDTGPLSKTVTYYYRIVATDGVETTTSNTASIVIPAVFTTSTLSESETVENFNSIYTLTIQPDTVITSGTVTLAGLDASQTTDNASLSITSTSNIFGTSADWTQSTGTLVLTVSTTVPNNADTVVTFTIQNPSHPNSGSTGITLDASGFTQAAISGTFMSVSQDPLLNLPTFPTIALVDSEDDIIKHNNVTADALTNPANKVTIAKALDTDDLYVWTGGEWVIFNDDGISP